METAYEHLAVAPPSSSELNLQNDGPQQGPECCTCSCCVCWLRLSKQCRLAILVASIFGAIAILGGLAAGVAVLELSRTIKHVPSSGHGRPIPTFVVYPGPYDARNGTAFPAPSPLYSVGVSFSYLNGTLAAKEEQAFVYFNSIAHRMSYPGASIQHAGQSVSWTGFAFDSSLVFADVTITAAFSISACILRPRSYGLTCDTSAGSSIARVRIPRSPLKISVELYSAGGNSAAFVSQPLFLFPDPPEDPALVPSPGDRGVLYYARGVHNLSGQIPLSCGTNNVYLEPGAYVSGGFITTCSRSAVHAAEQVVISGRGVVTGEQFPWHSTLFKWALINIDEGTQNVVDGLTLVDSPEFHIASYSDRPTLRNVKMMSWTYNSDGFDAGTGGLAEDIFVKANDDSIKINGAASGSLVQRIVVWQQVNGAVVQLGWVSPLSESGATVRDIDVIRVCYCCTAAGWCATGDNNAIVDLAPDGTSVFNIDGVTIENVRVEGDAVRLLYVELPVGSTGSFSGLALRNISADAVSLPTGMSSNYLGALSSSSSLSNILFENVSVGDSCWLDTSAAHLYMQGGVSGVTFRPCV